MSFWEESQVGNFIFWRFGLFLFCLFWRAFLFFGQAAHHGFFFGYSQCSGDWIFGGNKHFFLGNAAESLFRRQSVQYIVGSAVIAVNYLRERFLQGLKIAY